MHTDVALTIVVADGGEPDGRVGLHFWWGHQDGVVARVHAETQPQHSANSSFPPHPPFLKKIISAAIAHMLQNMSHRTTQKFVTWRQRTVNHVSLFKKKKW